MIFIQVQEGHYHSELYEAESAYHGMMIPEGTRVLAWVNYLKDIGIKRYYIAEKYKSAWYFITVDVFPEDYAAFWDICTKEAFERDHYINSVYNSYEDGSFVINVKTEEEGII